MPPFILFYMKLRPVKKKRSARRHTLCSMEEGHMVSGNNTYIAMLKDTLIQKKKVTEEILWVTLEQETALAPELEDMERFDALMEKKEPLLLKLEQLDGGFSDIYAKVQATLNSQREAYKDEILGMQQLIREITDISVKIQALEERNRRMFETYLLGRKQQFKTARKNSRTADAYSKTMTGTPQGESYFMDKRK